MSLRSWAARATVLSGDWADAGNDGCGVGMPPNTDMTRSWASLSGSTGPPTSGPRVDAVVGEQGQREPELVAVEGTVGFADHHIVEAAIAVGESAEELAGFGPALPGQGAAESDVKVRGDDAAAAWRDEAGRERGLPVTRGLGVLVVLGGYTSVERELSFRCPGYVIRPVECRWVRGREGAVAAERGRRRR
jgi:hypothetical protein